MNGQWPHDFQQHTNDLMEAERNGAPSVVDVANAFYARLVISSPAEREMMIAYLRAKVCIECGAPDPDCPCWERDEVAPS